MAEHSSEWTTLPSDLPDLFERLAELGRAEVLVRFSIGTEGRYYVEVPGCRLMVEGRLRVRRMRNRLEIQVPGWNREDFAWFGRRKGRGRPDYWQGAIEHRPEGRPALVLYFTAPLDGLEIRVRPVSCPP